MLAKFDRGSFLAKDPTRPRVIEGVVARVHEPGDALEYSTGPEHRDQAALEELVAQLPGLPVVTYDQVSVDTPPGHPGDLLSNGAPYLQIGVIMDARVEDGKAVARIYFHDVGALDAIDDGIKELSLGYRCSLDGERFQRNILLDHLSVVPRARCGGACALRTDAAGAKACSCVATSVPDAKPAVMIIGQVELGAKIVLDEESKRVLAQLQNLDGTKVETVSADVVQPEHKDGCTCNSRAIAHTTGDSTMDTAEIQTKLDEALAEIAALKTSAEKTELELNQAKADLKAESARADKLAEDIEAVKADAKTRVDAAAAARTDAEDKAFDAAVDSRVELLADAAKVGVEDARTKTNREIKVAIVKKVDEMDIEDDRSPDYVNGMYAGAMKRHIKAAASLAEVRTTIEENHDGAAAVTTRDIVKVEEEARKANSEKKTSRWRH